MRTTNSPHRN